MTAAAAGSGPAEFVIEDIITGFLASGFGHLGDGRAFSFRVHRGRLAVEVYRPRLAGPVPAAEDVIATAVRVPADFDVDDERSVIAAVRDALAIAVPAARPVVAPA